MKARFILTILLLLPILNCGEASRNEATDVSSALLEKGAQIYRVHCRACHLPEGDAPVIRMRLNDTQWNHGGTPDEVERTISEGVNGTQMLSFKYKLSPEEIEAVATFVRSLCERE